MSLSYTYDASVLEATVTAGPGTSYSGTITIPDTVNYDDGDGVATYNVTAIQDQAFKNYSNLTGVTIGNNVTTIGSNVFQLSGLTAVEIPATVTSIGNATFKSCIALTTVTFAAGSEIITIGNKTFHSSGLTEVEIPASVTSIGNYAFYDCSALTTVTFAAGSDLTTINTYAFSNSGLTAVEIPTKVTSMGTFAFYYCSALTTVTFAAGSELTTIGNSAFQQSGLTAVEIPASVTSIGNLAFYACTDLDTVTFKHTAAVPSITFSSNVFLNVNATYLVIQQSPTTLGGNEYTVGMVTIPNLSDGTFANVSMPANICFPAGTLVSLDQGNIEIQKVDTNKHTLNGKQILFVTKTFPSNKKNVCFEKDAFEQNVPNQTVECSKKHLVEYNGECKRAIDFVNNDKITLVPNAYQTMYNLLLESHEMMTVCNLQVETLYPLNDIAIQYLKSSNEETDEQ